MKAHEGCLGTGSWKGQGPESRLEKPLPKKLLTQKLSITKPLSLKQWSGENMANQHHRMLNTIFSDMKQ